MHGGGAQWKFCAACGNVLSISELCACRYLALIQSGASPDTIFTLASRLDIGLAMHAGQIMALIVDVPGATRAGNNGEHITKLACRALLRDRVISGGVDESKPPLIQL